MKRIAISILLSLALLITSNSFSQQLGKPDDSEKFLMFDLQRENLSGNWGGHRANLADKGVEVEVTYTSDYFSNISGGIEQKAEYLDNIDIIFGLDFGKLFGIKNGMMNIYILGNNGGSPTEHIGDAQTVSNIDADDTWKIYEFWYDQYFSDNKMSLRFGLYDLNSEFDAIESAGLFINSSHGIGPDYSQSGLNGPSIFPNTSLALRALYHVNETVNIQFAIFDGVPGDPENPEGTHIIFKPDDGALISAEINWINTAEDSPHFKYAIGGWYYSSKFEKIDSINEKGSGNSGIYILAEKNILCENDTDEQGLAAYGRLGLANTNYNQIGNYFGTGLVYTGLFPGRDTDKTGLALAIASNSSKYVDLIEENGGSIDKSEINLEFSYYAELLPWLTFQPDIQYIINPGFNSNLENSLAIALRFGISF